MKLLEVQQVITNQSIIKFIDIHFDHQLLRDLVELLVVGKQRVRSRGSQQAKEIIPVVYFKRALM